MSNQTITITVNGESVTCPYQISVGNIITKLDYNPRLVAIEYNGEILHRQHWSNTQLNPGDQLEIVTIVGGGFCQN